MRKNAILLGAVLLAVLSALSYAQVPFVNQPLVPDATAPGGPEFTLTVNGTGFVPDSVVMWNKSALVTQFISGSQLKATVPAANIATASTGWVTVVNPAPGGGTSNVAFFTVTHSIGGSVAFTLASSPATGVSPFALAVGDFNGDGKLDMAVANGDNTVSILLGDGRGQFTWASSPTTGYGPSSVAVGDFNSDGNADLAVTNSCGSDPNCESRGTVSILLGDGMGNFTLASSPITAYSPSWVALGDFNSDGKLDLAVSSPYAGVVSVFLGDGLGNFSQAWATFPGLRPFSVAVGDFNQDGKLDLAVFGYLDAGDKVVICLGDGAGHFTQTSEPDAGGWGYAMAVGDFNRDGKLDLVVANWFVSTVSVLRGDGAGRFSLASSSATGALPQALAIGDLNGDGKLDLAVVVYNDRTTDVMLGDDTGKFVLASSLANPANVYPGAVAIGDFNDDGKLDVATVDGYLNTVQVQLQVPTVLAVALSPSQLTFGAQLPGTKSVPQSVTLRNTGSATLNLTKIAASGSFSQTNNCRLHMAPGASCTINVSFQPRLCGKLKGTITITDDADNSPQQVALSGVGTCVVLAPLSLNFGDQPLGTTSAPQTVTLINHTQRTVNITGISRYGTNPGSFSQTNTCGTSVAAGASCTISVTFTPLAKRIRTANLSVRYDAVGTPQQVTLTGNGT